MKQRRKSAEISSVLNHAHVSQGITIANVGMVISFTLGPVNAY